MNKRIHLSLADIYTNQIAGIVPAVYFTVTQNRRCVKQSSLPLTLKYITAGYFLIS